MDLFAIFHILTILVVEKYIDNELREKKRKQSDKQMKN